MHEVSRNPETELVPEPMPLFAKVAVTFALSVTTACLVVMKVVAGG